MSIQRRLGRGEVEDDLEDETRDLAADFMELAVSVGLLNSVIEQYPEHVQENWARRVRGMRGWAQAQTEEIQSFAEAYD